VELEAQLAAYRTTRRELEASILPLATSIDGRRFVFQAPADDVGFQVGGYVVLDRDGSSSLGQTLGLELAHRDVAQPDGPVIGVRYVSGHGAWSERAAPARARLGIGELALLPGVAHALDAGGFDRHTFLCGQSGSGKTYSLGVIIEQLLMNTGLRVVILDPNSDFVGLGATRAAADAQQAERYAAIAGQVEVRRAGVEGAGRLRLRLAELDTETQAALLRLDPIADREEYAELVLMLAEERPPSVEALKAVDRPEARRLAMRATNLGVEELGIWARGQSGSVLDAAVAAQPRCLVVDLGSLATREEQALVSAAVLRRLWAERRRREPVLIVIDEAHNVCPGAAEDPLTALAAETAVRIAAEGRKFGLYLLVSTQRPQKIHENVLSQADNLVLMRLNSAADAAFTQAAFSFVPPDLIARAAGFRLGEALVAGKISSHPALMRFGARVAEEGGADVPATWAAPRLG